MYVRAGRPAFARPYAGVHRRTSLMRSSLLLQQCPACLVRLTWIVFVMGGRWPYSWCFVGCCRQDLFNIARNITQEFCEQYMHYMLCGKSDDKKYHWCPHIFWCPKQSFWLAQWLIQPWYWVDQFILHLNSKIITMYRKSTFLNQKKLPVRSYNTHCQKINSYIFNRFS